MSTILNQFESGITTLTLNRPEALNAMRQSEFKQLLALIKEFGADDESKVLILTGNGRGFCSGEDLKEASEFSDSAEEISQHVDLLQSITKAAWQIDKPMIAAVNGPAVGFGLEITLAFDVRIATENVYFWFSEAARGLIPTNGAFYLLPRIVGQGRAARMMLAAERISAEDALGAGLISEVCSPDALLSRARNLATQMSQNYSESMTTIKRLLRQSYTLSMSELMDLEVSGSLELTESGTSEDGIQKFVDRERKS